MNTRDAVLDAPPGVDFTPDGMPRRFQRRNFFLLLFSSGIFSLGWAMVSVVRTPYVNWLNISNQTIGLLGSIGCISLIGNFFSPLISRRFQRKKWLQFFLGLPYLWCDLSAGLAILIAMAMGDTSWLATAAIISFAAWPFMGGWASVPNQEYIANCISKERIGAFNGVSQIVAPILGLIGSAVMSYLIVHFDVPLRYALAFVAAYLLAQTATIFSLFAHETPAPPPPLEPFWKPAYDALVHDRVFQRLLLVSSLVWVAWLFPNLFMPLLAIREWGAPDWVAAGFATVQTAGALAGAALASWIGQKVGYHKALIYGLAFAPLSMLVLAWPVSSEMKKDSYEGTWTIASAPVAKAGRPVAPSDSNRFMILSHQPSDTVAGAVNEITVRFSRGVSAASFNEHDVKVRDPKGRYVEIGKVIPTDSAAREWRVLFTQPQTEFGQYRLMILPYITDLNGKPLDQDGGGHPPHDEYRFFVAAALWAISYSAAAVTLQSLMYILAPSNRRGGYFSIFAIVQSIAGSISYSLSGIAFRPGNYQFLFAVTGVAMLAVVFLCARLFKSATLSPVVYQPK